MSASRFGAWGVGFVRLVCFAVLGFGWVWRVGESWVGWGVGGGVALKSWS